MKTDRVDCYRGPGGAIKEATACSELKHEDQKDELFEFRVGAVLPNGAMILGHGDSTYGGLKVLAHQIKGDRDEWVTWRCDVMGNCHWGHYFFDHDNDGKGLLRAIQDFETR